MSGGMNEIYFQSDLQRANYELTLIQRIWEWMRISSARENK